MGGRLADIEQRLALQVVRADLVSDHDRPPFVTPSDFCPHAPESVAPSGWSVLRALPPAALAMPVRLSRRLPGRLRTDPSAAASTVAPADLHPAASSLSSASPR